MGQLTYAQLKDGTIFGDNANHEYIYMPASEIGVATPVCVLEKGALRQDLSLDEAVHQIARLNLRPVRHPKLGKSSC